jgi:hypothetical protein
LVNDTPSTTTCDTSVPAMMERPANSAKVASTSRISVFSKLTVMRRAWLCCCGRDGVAAGRDSAEAEGRRPRALAPLLHGAKAVAPDCSEMRSPSPTRSTV